MVDKNRVDGSAKNIGGKVKEGIGNVTGIPRCRPKARQIRPKAKFRTPSAGSKILSKTPSRRIEEGGCNPLLLTSHDP